LTAGIILAMAYMEKEEYPYNMIINNLCCIRITGKFGGVKNREREREREREITKILSLG
jgi:hypothetical protein